MPTNTPNTDVSDNKTKEDNSENNRDEAAKNKIPQASGDPGRTPGSAEGDEETIDEDIRQKEAEGKL